MSDQRTLARRLQRTRQHERRGNTSVALRVSLHDASPSKLIFHILEVDMTHSVRTKKRSTFGSCDFDAPPPPPSVNPHLSNMSFVTGAVLVASNGVSTSSRSESHTCAMMYTGKRHAEAYQRTVAGLRHLFLLPQRIEAKQQQNSSTGVTSTMPRPGNRDTGRPAPPPQPSMNS